MKIWYTHIGRIVLGQDHMLRYCYNVTPDYVFTIYLNGKAGVIKENRFDNTISKVLGEKNTALALELGKMTGKNVFLPISELEFIKKSFSNNRQIFGERDFSPMKDYFKKIIEVEPWFVHSKGNKQYYFFHSRKYFSLVKELITLFEELDGRV